MVIHYFCRDGHWPYKLLDRDVSSPRFASRSLSRSLERQLAQICRWAALRLQAWNVTFQERLRVVEKLGTCDLFVTSDGGFTISSREYRRFLSFLISYISNVYTVYIYTYIFLSRFTNPGLTWSSPPNGRVAWCVCPKLDPIAYEKSPQRCCRKKYLNQKP